MPMVPRVSGLTALERMERVAEHRTMARIPFSEILVPLGGRTANLRALTFADHLAHRLGAPVRIVSNVERDGNVRQRRELITQQLDNLGINVLGIELRQCDSVADALNDVATTGSVVVMAASAVSAIGSLLLGTDTAEVLSYSTAPVIAIGPHCQRDVEIANVVISVDGSEESEYAAALAGELTGALGADVTVLQVVSPDVSLPADLSEMSLVRQIATAVPTVGLKNWDVAHSTHPAPAIVDVASHIPGSLIAVGSRGMDRMHQVLFGSTTRRLIATSPVPVLVVVMHPEHKHAVLIDLAKGYREVPFLA